MKRFTVLLLLLCLVLCYTESFSASKGSTGWPIFRRPKSSKPDSITAVASIRGDLSGVFYNPSTIGTITQKEVFFFTELEGLANDSFQGVIYGQPIGKGGLALGYITYDAGRTTLYWIEGGEEQSDEVSLQKDSLLLVSYGFSLSNHLSMGISLKHATSNIAGLTPNTYAVCGDIGFIYTQGINGFSISLAGQNIGTSTEFLDEKEELPMSAWAGISYTHTVGENKFIGIGADAGYLVREERLLPGVGFEYGIGDFAFNIGYFKNPNEDSEDEAGMQVGFGFTSGTIEVGYSYMPSQFLNPVQRFNLSFLF